MNPLLFVLCTSLLLLVQSAPGRAAQDDEQAPLIQIFFGVLELDDQSANWDEISDNGVDVDFSSLPSGGIEAEYLFGKGWVHWGLNPGGSIAWKNDDTNISGSQTNENGGTLRVEIDNSLFLSEVHLGGYVRGRLNERITTYAAAGPMVMYGYIDVKNESVDGTPEPVPNGALVLTESDSSDISLGYYSRAGIDFELGDNQHLGLGIRYLSTELDFDKTVGKLDIKGPQYVLTYTAPF